MSPALTVHEIHIQSVDMFGPRVGFLKFKARVAGWGSGSWRGARHVLRVCVRVCARVCDCGCVIACVCV